MKRRKFVTAGAFIAALLAAALAAASVGSAATAQTGKYQALKIRFTKHQAQGQSQRGQVANAGVSKISPVDLKTSEAYGHQVAQVNRPTRGAQAGLSPAAPVGGSVSGAINIPHIHSTPVIGNKKYDFGAQGLNDFWQEATHGFGLTPPDQGLAEGNGQVVEADNLNIIVMDNTFQHWNGVGRLEDLFAPAILSTGQTFISDPKVYYDQDTNRWFITVLGTDGASSSVFIAVSTTGDAAGAYAIYILDVTNDGTDCKGGCLGDQPLIGADRYTFDISTNSFSLGDGALNGAQFYVIDKTALVGQQLFPTVWYADLGEDTQYPGYKGGLNTCGVVKANPNTGYCISSVQPAESPNAAYNGHFGGTEFALNSLDPLAGQDNRIFEWAFTGTAGVSFQPPAVFGFVVGTEAYGFPFTNSCMVMPQMTFFGLPVDQCGFAEQPSTGNVPWCDYFFFGPGCEPGGIQANDDRMNQVQAITGARGVTILLSGVNTDAAVSDPLGVLHRRDAVAWFAVQGFGGIIGQGYIGNWQNDVLYPSVVATVTSGGTSAVAALDVTGNNVYPSFGLAKFSIHGNPSSIGIGVPGQDSLDDFCTDAPICGFASGNPETLYRPRYGDYSAAVADGANVYAAGEYSGSSCDEATFENTGFQCNVATHPITPIGFPTPRGFFSNWATGLLRTHT